MNPARVILTAGARADLAEVAHYTRKEWGKKQALKYAGFLDQCFENIADHKDVSKPIFPDNDMVRTCRCEHHYVFYLRKNKQDTPIILAILHEKMDLMRRLKNRLPE